MPKGWAPSRSGAIYFRPTNAADKAIVKAITGGPLSFKLADTEAEAHDSPLWLRVVKARKQERAVVPGEVSEIVDCARRKYLPKIKNEATREWRSRHVDELEQAFGKRRYARNVYEVTKAPGAFLTAVDVQGHIDKHQEDRPVAVNRAVKTWGILWKEARRRWGLTEYNPCTGLDFNPEEPRDVLPADQAIRKVYRKLDPPMRFMVAMIRYYGRRRGEILGLTLSSAQDDGMHFQRGKARSGRVKEIVIRWDRRLTRMWARLMRWRAEVKREGKLQTTMALLNRKGGRYTATGFMSAWRRAQLRAGVRGTFTFHDIRASRASSLSREDAVEVLAHDDPRTTAEIYRRGPHVIDLNAGNSRNDSRNTRKSRT